MKLMDISQRCTKLQCLNVNLMENDLDHENEKLNVYVKSETNIWERRGGVGEIRMNKNEWIVLFKNICYIDIQNHNQLMKVNIAADAASKPHCRIVNKVTYPKTRIFYFKYHFYICTHYV